MNTHIPPTEIALVILEDRQGRILLQLRSQVDGIANPGKWGLFGGHLEPGESPIEAAVREIEEELTCALLPEKMCFVTEFNREDGLLHYSLFQYPVTNELENAALTEGERFAAFSPGQIQAGLLDGAEVVPHHFERLKAFWDRQAPDEPKAK